ncbi:MAG: hypothetical protein R6V58_10050 [Planctomycetota bacterium]
MSEDTGQKSASREFRFVLRSVQPDSLRAVAVELTKLFPLDLPNAVNIARNTPLILLERLTPEQARSVGSYAVRLRALGAEVELTSEPVGKLQVLRWPLLPDVAKRPGTHLICPSCGARLQFSVLEPARPTALQAEASEEGQPAGAPEPSPQPSAEPAGGGGEEEEVILEPLEEDAEPAAEAVAEPHPAEEEPVEAVEVIEEAAEPRGRPVGGQGSHRVMLVGKIRGKKKRNAAELMAYYQGTSEEAALDELNKRTVVTLARDLTEEQAEQCQDEFGRIGVKARITGGE